ncbi:MAG TPA: hypothetical protein VM307_01755 [Egibacteraceae bacterium]|nr:hypothetical protein [Egibacteraceae bacterium]
MTATSSKDLSNVVLVFQDGTTQRFEGLKGTSGTFSGTGANAGKTVTSAYVKSGRERSGDGPGYGRHFSNGGACVAGSDNPGGNSPGGNNPGGNNPGGNNPGGNNPGGNNGNGPGTNPGKGGKDGGTGTDPDGVVREPSDDDPVVIVHNPNPNPDVDRDPSPDRTIGDDSTGTTDRVLASTGGRLVLLTGLAALSLLLGGGLLGIRRFVRS